jgi:manganese efflux pump family protein
MGIAALVAWLLTALGGFYLLATWITKGGTKTPRTSHFPPAVIFGHFALAAVGLVVWIIFLIADTRALAWTAFVLLVPVALLGFVMLARWVPTYRARATVTAGAGDRETAPAPAERHFPVAVVGGHGLFAVVTLVLVLLTALGVGGA